MSTTDEVTQTDLLELFKIFEKKSFEAGSCEDGSTEAAITKKCESLFKQDYTLIELDNANGILCPRYPGRIFIPETERSYAISSTLTTANLNVQSSLNQNAPSISECSTTPSAIMQQNQQHQAQYSGPSNYLHYQQQRMSSQNPSASTSAGCSSNKKAKTSNTIYEDQYDANKIRELITMAKYARCRRRFVVPVIMYRGKYICRSATISINAETYGRKVVDCAYDYLNGTNYSSSSSSSSSERGAYVVDDENNDNSEDLLTNNALNEPSPFSYEEVIKSDVQLLNALNVGTIVDLMVEKRKVKYFVTVSSSEKADPDNHYEKFNILSLPYPGCEFFKQFRENDYVAKNLRYDWNQSFIDADISVPTLGPTNDLNINWSEYKNWDLVLLTQNYIKACLRYIQEEKSGLLVHCISGWDRTPLFTSLLRLSLWADGLIHQSLNELQITYLVAAYDWYLFGHQLPDRQKRGEDIMIFCFHVLKFLAEDEFSIAEPRKRTKTSSSSGSSSIIVLKTDNFDDELPREDSIACDQDSNDSFSNSSNCDMSTTDNFNLASTTPQGSGSSSEPYIPITNRSPSTKRTKTSPITVPGATRHRHESTSSTGSWQVVTETGSIDSMRNSSFINRSLRQTDGSAAHNTSGSSNSTNVGSANSTLNTSGNGVNSALNNTTGGTNPKDIVSGTKANCTTRKERLNNVRAMFVQSYGKTIGLQFIEGSSLSFGAVFGTITDQLF